MNINPITIAARTMLCTLNTSAWRATKLHKGETRAERLRHSSDAPRVLVTICTHSALSELACLHAKAYADHRRLTLPTIQDGMRMLPAARQMEHADTMRLLGDSHNRIVGDFLADYDRESRDAPHKLKGLYDSAMWPDHSEVASKFGFGAKYLPCPTGGAWDEWLAESAHAASADLQDRLREALERVRDRCTSDGKLYASVFGALGDLLSLVPDMDITGELTALAQAAAPLASLSAETLRDSKQGRAQAASSAASILTMLGGVQ